MQIEFQLFQKPSPSRIYSHIKFFLFDYWKEKFLLTFIMIKQSYHRNHRSKRRRSHSSRVVHVMSYLIFCLTIFQIMNIQGTVIDKFSWIQIFDSSNILWENANYTGKCNRLYKEKETVRLLFFLVSIFDMWLYIDILIVDVWQKSWLYYLF